MMKPQKGVFFLVLFCLAACNNEINYSRGAETCGIEKFGWRFEDMQPPRVSISHQIQIGSHEIRFDQDVYQISELSSVLRERNHLSPALYIFLRPEHDLRCKKLKRDAKFIAESIDCNWNYCFVN